MPSSIFVRKVGEINYEKDFIPWCFIYDLFWINKVTLEKYMGRNKCE